MKIKCLYLFCLIITFSSAYAELFFYPLSHKAPAEIISSIRPFLQTDETVTAGHNELILRVSTKNKADIQTLIKRLDQPAHRLIIYVNRDGKFDRHTQGYNVNSRLKVGVGKEVSSRYKGDVNVYSTRNITNDKNNQSLQVLDGHTAHISEGVSEPITRSETYQYGEHNHTSNYTSYRDASKGFYVTPRLSKDFVILEIAPQYESSLSENRTSAEFVRASSVIRGPLNTWIKFAGFDDNASKNSEKILGYHAQTTIKKNTIWVKVVDLDANLSN